ncbi:hypothetical protein KHA80_10835 [Anaerobacillus sp. HL2]|nr:hypothetical protein KHA80_10835 [Anaerobacillus sp. HL2]
MFENNISQGSEDLFLFFDTNTVRHRLGFILKTLYDQHPSYKIMALGSTSPMLVSNSEKRCWKVDSKLKYQHFPFYELYN